MVQLESTAEKKAMEAVKYTAFHGTELFLIKEKVTYILGMIGREGLFSEYTKHDISHINRLLESLEWIIPAETKEQLTPGEWLMIVLSIYFHDLGMLVTKDEYDNRNKSSFPEFKRVSLATNDLEFLNKIEKMQDDEKEKFLYQEFVRNKHAERVKVWISGQGNNAIGVSDKVVQEIAAMLSHLDPKFKKDLGLICESHHLDDLDDFQKYKTVYRYGSSPQEKVNIHYCAIILRTADLLHITSDRTPSTELRLINPSDPKSQVEWSKQRAVSAVAPKFMRNKEGDIDPSIPSHVVEVTAYFRGEDGAKGFFGLISYIAYAKHELKQSFEWVKKSLRQGSTYHFPWNDIDDTGIETEGFERKLFEFKLDQAKILQLLVGHTLYNDSTVVLRELIQNAIDAIRLQNFIDTKSLKRSLSGEIKINWDSSSRLLSFFDNGTGMTQDIIENHLLKVGSSRYQSDSFRKEFPGFTPISRFGIGILTCFMIADNVSIVSSHPDDPTAKKLTIKNVDGKYLLQHIEKGELDVGIRPHGTIITLEVRREVPMDNLEANIKRWILFPPCGVSLFIDNGSKITIGYESPAKAMEAYLTDIGYDVNGKTIKVAQDSLNDIDIAFALSYSEIFKEWSFITRPRQDFNRSVTPIGTCIEGVRVEFDSPGYNGRNLLSVVNASGKHAPKTNVARSNIEANDSRSAFLKTIYTLYLNHVEKEIESIQKNTDFSVTWALNEAPILLAPIIKSDENINAPVDKALLFEQLENSKLILTESNYERKVTTIAAVKKLENLWTIDCDLFRSAESLIKEIKSSPPLTSLIRTLYNGQEEKMKHIDNLLCMFRNIDSISEYALSGRCIGPIKIFRVERRVDVCWTNIQNTNWTKIGTKFKRKRAFGDGGRSRRSFYLQTQPTIIEGLQNEQFVEFFNNVLILIGSPINSFVNSIINDFAPESNDEDAGILSTLMGVISRLLHTSDITKVQLEKWAKSIFDQDLNQNDAGISVELFWKRIDKDLLFQSIIDTNWSTFSPASWQRDKSDYHV